MRAREVPDGVGSDAGSLLVEAVVGIGLLGLVTAATATLLPAALDAETRARAHYAVLVLADSLVELESAGLDAAHTPLAAPLDAAGDAVSIARDGDADTTCEATLQPTVPRTSIHVEQGGRSPGRDVALHARPVGAPTLTLRTRVDRGVPADALVLLGAGGLAHEPARSGYGCVAFPGLEPGSTWVTTREDSPPLIDRAHVTLDARPVPVTLDRLAHDRMLDVAPAASVRVVVDDDGARRPDFVRGGAMRWFVRGDDANLGAGFGEARSVHPGPVTVVVPPCDDATATGSTATVQVAPGDEVTHDVALAVVTITNVRSYSDGRLHLQRTSGCADGTGLRPMLRFDGGLHDGMRVALPRGEWDAWIRMPSSSTGSVRFAAAGTDTVVRIP